MAIINTPFTDKQVELLNKFQKSSLGHQYTCGNEHEGNKDLVATTDGWICPNCDYKQTWCHKTTLELSEMENKETTFFMVIGRLNVLILMYFGWWYILHILLTPFGHWDLLLALLMLASTVFKIESFKNWVFNKNYENKSN